MQTVAGRTTPAWIGYRVPIARRVDVAMQSVDACCGRCRLAPSSDLVVLARVQNGSILELRPLAVDCDMDAGGMPLIWFDGVNPDASVAWLSTLVTTPTAGRSRMAESALMAIAQHAGSAAPPALVRFAQSGTADVRGRALFWLAQMNDPRATDDIVAALKSESSDDVREDAVFALSQLDGGQADDALIAVLRGEYSRAVKKQALFWLGQSGSSRAMAYFDEALK